MGEIRNPPIRCLMSDWEIVEAYQDHRGGTSIQCLAERYGVGLEALRKVFKRMEQKEGR